ncbi:hypothetical protein HY449_00225 [Candidatus Pacearchaeota archaeon]|nr:hypothetical protein [Candidatus Pacearchaeota archaeon]
MKPNYFLVSVSNRENLNLCISHALAGFTNSINGLWTFYEINEGDYISFLYAARAHNLYQVIKKEAINNADKISPWKSVTFKMSGKTYYFPFRLKLKPIREFNEPLVRNEFSYVAENLLLRGGYRKTHFQGDQTTLQNVSQMGKIYKKEIEDFDSGSDDFIPKFTRKRNNVDNPRVFLFSEIILQTLIRHYLSENDNMKKFLEKIKINELKANNLEILGEKALPEGHIDLLIKEAVPIGLSRNIIIEVKLGKATEKDFQQLKNYIEEFGEECLRGVLIANDFSSKLKDKFNEIAKVKYSLEDFDSEPKSFSELSKKLKLEDFKG